MILIRNNAIVNFAQSQLSRLNFSSTFIEIEIYIIFHILTDYFTRQTLNILGLTVFLH